MKHSPRVGNKVQFRKLFVSLIVVAAVVWGVLGASNGRPPSGQSVYGANASQASSLELPYQYISVGWLDWAAVQLRDIVDDETAHAEASVVLGLVLEALENRDEAAYAYERVGHHPAADSGDRAVALALLGQVLFDEGRIDEAQSVLKEAADLNPQAAVVHWSLGRISQIQGAEAEAEEQYRRAADLAPDWLAPTLSLGRLHNSLGEHGAAVTAMHPQMALATGDSQFQYELALGITGWLENRTNRTSVDADDRSDLIALFQLDPLDGEQQLKNLALHAVDRAVQLSLDERSASALVARLDALSFVPAAH